MKRHSLLFGFLAFHIPIASGYSMIRAKESRRHLLKRSLSSAAFLRLLRRPANAVENSFQTWTDSSGASFSVPKTWERKETALEASLGSGPARRLVVFVNPLDADENAFILFSPVQPDYTSLSSFGNIENVASTILPPAEFPSEMIEMSSKKGNYNFDYVIEAPGEPKRHLKTIFCLVPSKVIITFTSQTREVRYKDISDTAAETLNQNIASFNLKQSAT